MDDSVGLIHGQESDDLLEGPQHDDRPGASQVDATRTGSHSMLLPSEPALCRLECEMNRRLSSPDLIYRSWV